MQCKCVFVCSACQRGRTVDAPPPVLMSPQFQSFETIVQGTVWSDHSFAQKQLRDIANENNQ